MHFLKSTITLSLSLLPFAASYADDQETQQLHNNTYQQSAFTSCDYSGDCAMTFPATTHITTAVTNVSCFFNVPSGTPIQWAAISFEQAVFYLPLLYYGSINGRGNYGINGAVNLYVAKGGKPQASIFTYGAVATNFSCTISGYHS